MITTAMTDLARVWCLTLCLLFMTPFLHAQVSTTDSLALVALYNATDGDNWTSKVNWLTGPVSTWEFVEIENDAVIRITFNSENNLNGMLPPEIGTFAALDWLIINGQSRLTGSLPSEIGNLSTLRFLLFTNSSVSGEIPSSIGNLTSLVTLDLSGNDLNGTVPASLSNLINLTTIDLEDNYLESIPDLSTLTALTRLEIASNRLGYTDILKNTDITTYKYAPQKTLTTDTFFVLAPGSDITFSYDTTGIGAETILWLENSDTVQQNNPEVAIENIQLDPAVGQINQSQYPYKMVLTNSALPDLTLETGIFYVIVTQTRPVPRSGGVTFQIGDRNYLGLGRSKWGYLRDLNDFRDSPTGIAWSDKAIFPGEARAEAVSFVIGESAYVGTGIGADDTLYNDFYKYTPATDTWERIADFPGGARYNAVGFSSGQFGYVGTGRTAGDEQADFWRYDPTANEWQQVASSPAGKRQGAFIFTVRGRPFVGGGYYRDDFTFFQQSDIYEYDVEADEWIERVFADGINLSINDAVGFELYDHGYIFSGNKTDLIKYNPFDHTYENLGNVFDLEEPVKDPFAIDLPEYAYLPTDSFGFPYEDFETIFHRYKEEDIPMSDLILTGSEVPENNDPVTFVGVLSVTDPDQDFPHRYSTSSPNFFVSNDSVYTNAVFDHEERSGYTDGFRVEDNRGNQLSINPVITVVDVNEAPTDIILSNDVVAEADGFATIGTLSAVDADFGDNTTFMLAEEDRDRFTFSSTRTLVIENADFETEPEVRVTVTATDKGGLTFTKEFTVRVTNVNEPPTAIQLSDNEVDIESAPGTVVGTLSSEDPEDSGGFTYRITNEADEFAIEADKLVTTALLNDFRGFEPEIAVAISSTDPEGLSYEQTITVMLLNITGTDLPSSLTVYPNPAGTYLVLNDGRKEVHHIRLTDMNGRTVLGKDISDVSSLIILDLAGVRAGSYILNIATVNKTYKIKLLKK